MSLTLVTGASGWIGGRLTDALTDAGTDVRGASHRRRAQVGDSIRGDLRDPGHAAATVRGVETVFHCAAALAPVPSERLADEINHRATVTLARAAADAGVRRFVYVSSAAAIGWRDSGMLSEEGPCDPSTPYGRSKRAAEIALGEMDLSPMRVAIVRPPTVYGPGERRNFLALTRAIARGGFPILGSGQNRVSFCHLDNLVEALRHLAGHEGIVHVADASITSFARVVHTIARACGTRPFPVRIPLRAARIGARALELAYAPFAATPPLSRARLLTLTADCALDTTRLRGLGFRWPTGFDEGVRETVASYRAVGAL